MKIENARAIVTGGTSGIGYELCKLLVDKGASVITCARRERATPGELILADVSKISDVEKLLDFELKKLGGIDILVNNAGTVHDLGPVEELPPAEVERVFSHNVFSMFYMIRACIPIMKKQKSGLIVNIASKCGVFGVPNLTAYCASKAAVVGLTRSLALELKDTGIKCICISPSGVNTSMRTRVFGAEDAQKQQSPETVAKLILDIIEDKESVVESGDNFLIQHGTVKKIKCDVYEMQIL